MNIGILRTDGKLRKIHILLFSLFLNFTLTAQNPKLDSIEALSPQKISTVVKTNPTSIFLGVMPVITSEYRLLLEFPSAPMQSSQIGFSYLGKGPLLRYIEKDTIRKNPNAVFLKMVINGFRAQGSYRFFFNGWMEKIGMSEGKVYAPEGFYLSPHISFSTIKVTYKFANQYDVYYRINHFNVNLLAGFQFLISGKYTVDMFTGIGYKENEWAEHFQNKVKVVSPPKELDTLLYSGPVKISMGINFGYCF